MILEAICNGSFYPFEDVNPRDPEYLDAHHRMCDILEILSQKLYTHWFSPFSPPAAPPSALSVNPTSNWASLQD